MANRAWHIKKKTEKILRLRRHRRKWVKIRNIHRQLRKQVEKPRRETGYLKFIDLHCPEFFNLIKYPSNVIGFINKIQQTVHREKHRPIHLRFKMDNIKDVESGALALLLSKLHEVGKPHSVMYSGNFPKNQKCKEYFEESGFLSFMRVTGVKLHSEGKNMISVRGFDKTDNKKTANIIVKAVEHLTGQKNKFQPVYSVIQEICGNSIEHANELKEDKNWLLTVNHTPDEVTFTVSDMGKGIIETIKRKFIRSMAQSPHEMLQSVFDKRYESCTREINRNKGLPKIQDVAQKKYINNLIVIANNAYLDFDNPSKSKTIGTPLYGTFYHWTINKESIIKWQTRLKN